MAGIAAAAAPEAAALAPEALAAEPAIEAEGVGGRTSVPAPLRSTRARSGETRARTSQRERATSAATDKTKGKGKGKRKVPLKAPDLAGKTSAGILLAEYIAGALLIAMAIFTRGPSRGYIFTMTQIILRLTALTGVFFVLMLVASSPKAGKAAAWFGLLVDLGILFTAVNDNQVKMLQSIVRGQPTGVDQPTLTASLKTPEPEYTQLPDTQPENAQLQ